MTLEDLENALPNGLHDAEVKRIAVDYESRKATLEVAVWIGDMNDPPEQREAYKDGRIDISGLLFLVMEPPDPKCPYKDSDLTVDGCDLSKSLSGELLKSLPPDSFVRSLWVNQWNAFIHIAAKDANIEWLNDGTITYRKSQ
jgi:hypothetical protein